MRLLVTGGHIAPALACIDEALKKKDRDILFVGRKYNNNREQSYSFEYTEINKRKIPFIHLITGRITRRLLVTNLFEALLIPVGFIQSVRIIRTQKPDVVLSFGGYLAFPISIVASIMGIPVYIHEQTINPGLTNRTLGLFAKEIFVSFEQTKKFFPAKKTVITGNPVRDQVFHTIKKSFDIDKKTKVIYVTGGSLGSHAINAHILHILPDLLKDYTVIHQTGNIKEFGDYESLVVFRETLPEELKKRYIVRHHISSQEVGYVYSVADLIVSRIGANTFFELVALHKPSILIPLPWSAHQEQQQQAELLKKSGVAEIFDQSDTSENLLKLIYQVMENKSKYLSQFYVLKKFYKTNAAEEIISKVIGS